MKDAADLARGWLAKAASDLGTARALIAGPGPYDTACFHCQQAAEKFMKGFLAAQGSSFPFTHDLDELARLCEGIDQTLGLQAPEIISLTDYAVSLRYDNDFWPSKSDAEKALAAAGRVRDAVLPKSP
jgi:HEPN domain-containing protein